MKHSRIIFILLITLSHSVAQAQWTKNKATPNAGAYCFITYSNSLYMGGPFQYQIKRPGMIFSNLGGIGKWNGASWDSLGTGLNGQVSCMAVYNNELVMAGSFTLSNGIPCNNIIKWNGTSFSTLGTGFPNSQNVRALCVYNSSLYAAGTFTNAGGVTVSHIARWNGTAWSAVGTGLNGQAYDLEVYSSKLYVSGLFTSAGGVPAKNIARWNGTAWDSVTGGIDGLADDLQVYNNELYAGGNFYQAGAVPVNHLAKWNGTSWLAVNSGTTPAGLVTSLSTYQNRLIVTGSFTNAGAVTATNIISWTGTQWLPLGIGDEFSKYTYLFVSYQFQNDLFVSGTFTELMGDSCYYLATFRLNSQPVGLEEAHRKVPSLLAYPSPAIDKLTVEAAGGGRISVFDVSGKLMMTRELENRLTVFDLQLENGLYLLQHSEPGGVKTMKLIVEGK
jgi:trimeric autotransporter adhesin